MGELWTYRACVMKSITFNLEPLKVRKAIARDQGLVQCNVRNFASAASSYKFQLEKCGQCESTVPNAVGAASALILPQNFKFTLGGLGMAGAVGLGAALDTVVSIAPVPVSNAARVLKQKIETATSQTTECKYMDQYSVGFVPPVGEENFHSPPKEGCARFCELLHGVAISNDTSHKKGLVSKLIGPTGHYERLSFWTHFGGALLFVIYAIARHATIRDDARLEGGMTTAAAWTIAAVFLSSSVYHATAPDLKFSMVTRVLDYAGIYTGIAVTTTADIAVATQGFRNVPYQTIADLPIAAGLLIAFFVWRRGMLPGESTWTESNRTSSEGNGCLIGRGLFSFGHRDLAHIQMRQSTSLLLFANYFMVVPAAFAVLGNEVTRVVLAFQVLGFVAVLLGMAIDRVFHWPDGQLVEGSMTCLACPSDGSPACGAVLNSHAVWHIVALVSAGLTCVSREYALSFG